MQEGTYLQVREAAGFETQEVETWTEFHLNFTRQLIKVLALCQTTTVIVHYLSASLDYRDYKEKELWWTKAHWKTERLQESPKTKNLSPCIIRPPPTKLKK